MARSLSSHSKMFGFDPILSIFILYGVFLAIPLFFFVAYIIFKTSEDEKYELFREEMKRQAQELQLGRRHDREGEVLVLATT